MNNVLTPIKAIRAKCIDCCCGDKKEVRECSITAVSYTHLDVYKRQ